MKIFSLMKVCLLILLMHSSWVLADSSILPVDSAVRVRVDFWKKVYTEITASQGFIHDSEDLSVIYETVTHRSKSRRARTRQVRSRKREIKSVLRSIYRKNLTGLTEREAEIMRKIPDPTRVKILEMTRNIRYQRGLKDRYLVGLERSYRYLERIKKIFKEEGVPVELSYLPHVESSFNYKAYSKVGAAGIWQFMRGTARQFGLKMTYASAAPPLNAAHYDSHIPHRTAGGACVRMGEQSSASGRIALPRASTGRWLPTKPPRAVRR